MICQICSKKKAEVHFTQVKNNDVTEMHLCEACASSMGLKGFSLPMNLIEEMVSDLGKFQADLPAQDCRCSYCGLFYGEFRNTGLLGCSRCYETFREQLIPLLTHVHGRAEHMGKAPLRLGRKIRMRSRILLLQKKMNEVVKKEEYEEAARIRDEIRAIEAEIDRRGLTIEDGTAEKIN